MTETRSKTETPDYLLALQLRVARRADELAQERQAPPGLNLHCWLLAEREVLSGTLTDWVAESLVVPTPAGQELLKPVLAGG